MTQSHIKFSPVLYHFHLIAHISRVAMMGQILDGNGMSEHRKTKK